jgi:spermidine synthase
LTETSDYPSVEGDWYFETERSGFAQGVRVRQRLLHEQTAFQELEVIDTDPFGRALVLDQALQTTERDEYMYHEMIVHVPMMTHPNPRRVLIIGGGDGGTLRRVLQHPRAQPTQVEIDSRVIEACRTHIPTINASAFDDPRAEVVVGDGIAFMRDNPGQFDIVIIDSTDPIGPAVQLFEAPFYRDVARSLATDGLMAAQSSSPLFMAGELRSQVSNMRQAFPLVRTYLGIVPAYPGSLWSYTIGSLRHDPTHVDRPTVASRLREAAIDTGYYSADVHLASFVLPPFIEAIVA